MSDNKAPVVLDTYPNPFIAETLVGILKDEGVPAFVDGANLTDEFATSQRAMGALSVRVFVPGDRLEDARKIIAAARAAGRLIEEEDAGDEGDSEDDAG